MAHAKERSLDNVLVVTIHKGFWASRECEVFRQRIYEKRIYRVSENRPNTYFLKVRALVHVLRYKPQLILIGYAHKLVPWFIRLKMRGILGAVKLVATNQIWFDDTDAQSLSKIIVYSRSEIAAHDPSVRNKYAFIPYAPPGQEQMREYGERGNYIFAGGGESRDFASLIEAIRHLDVPLKLVTFSPKKLGYPGTLPPNCQVYWRMPLPDFLNLMSKSLFVVVPLQEGIYPRGHTTVAQALLMGKAVITTRNASVDDYVCDGQEGILVAPGDVEGYRLAIVRLLENPELLAACQENARTKAFNLTYQSFAKRLVTLCSDVLAE